MCAMSDVPGYWMNETSGVLIPAVEALLIGASLTPEHIAALRAYFRQWIMAPGFMGREVEVLRFQVDGLQTARQIKEWVWRASEAGVDPL